MPSIESLPADQRAVLELVLRRGRNYDEIAGLLSIDRAGVRQRALAALDTLGPQTRIGPDRRALITDYLLDALPAPVASEVRDRLGDSATERAWARAVASELQGLSDHPLPEIPGNGRRPRAKRARNRVPAGVPSAPEPLVDFNPASNGVAALPDALELSDGAPRERPPRRRGSRLGGAVVLGLLAAVAIALVLVFVVFSGGGAHKAAAAPHSTKVNSKTTAASKPTVLSVVPLTPSSGAKSPVGAAEFVRIQGRMGVAIAAQGLPANATKPPNYYAAWLYNSQRDAYFLGFAAAVGSNGQLRTGGFVPADAARYHHLLLTLESVPKGCSTTTCKPKAPGRSVLEGTLKNL